MNDNKYDEFFNDMEESSRTEAFSVGVVLRIILAVTTAGFAFVYGAGLLNWLLPDFIARVMTTVVYVFGIDFMAYEWPRLAQKNATTEKQIGIANTGWMVSTGLSVTVTIVFTLLVFGEFISVAGKLKDAVDIMALVVGIGMPIFQGVWYMRYENASMKTIEAHQRAQHGAMKNYAKHTIAKEHEKERLGRLVDGVRKALPDVARKEAGSMGEDYFNGSTYEPSINSTTDNNNTIGFDISQHPEAVADFLSRSENRETISKLMKERKK